MTQVYVGRSITRREDERLITGAGTFVDDIKPPNLLHAAILRSPHAHAHIKSVDVSKALEIPGVTAVFTFEDIASFAQPIPMRMHRLPGLERFLQFPLAKDKVRYVGEPMAVAVADSRYLAEDALDAIEVTYESLPAVVDIGESLKNEIILHEEVGTNLAAREEVSIGDVEEAFRNAEYTRKEDFKVHRHTGNPMETRGMVASYDPATGDLTVWGATKIPHLNRELTSNLLNFPEEKMHFIEPDVGGGFGIRGEFYPEDLIIPFAAIKLERAIKWIEDRREHLMAANHSREVLWEIEVAAKRDGTILGARGRVYGNMGAYIRTHGGIVPVNAAKALLGPYRIRNYQCQINCVITNKTGMGTLRAPGAYEATFAWERLLDMVASDLNISPVDIRLKNLIQPWEMPYHVGRTLAGSNPTIYDSGDYPSALNQALAKMDYEKMKAIQGKFEDGKYHGIGLASFVKHTGFGPGEVPTESARIAVSGGNKVGVYVGIASLGQGHETILSQICADALGVPMDSISVFHGGTDVTDFGGGTYASRATVMGGNAVHLTSQKLKAKILSIAGANLGLSEADLDLRDGKVVRKDEEQQNPLLDLSDVIELDTEANRLKTGEPGVEETASFESNDYTYSYGTHVAHVAVDPDTGKIEILGYVAAIDVGRCINPLLVKGQTIGAAAMGIGGTMLEELVYDENGQLLASSFMDYLLPTSKDIPPIDALILEEAPSPRNPLGVKGAGEVGIVPTGAVLANAVSNALRSLGVEVRELPLSPNRIRELIRNASKSK